jgi:hypothetical protein
MPQRIAFASMKRLLDPCSRRMAGPANRLRRRGGTAVPRKPFLAHTVEFRLSGSEMQEQVVPQSGSKSWAAGRVLAIERVRTYLTRQGEATADTRTIGGVEVHAELREGGIFCTVQLGDFGAGDLVVVQVEVALY